MVVLRAFPFLALVVLAYNALIVFGTGSVTAVVGQVVLPSGDVWNIATGDVLVIFALALLFVEIVSSGSRLASLVNHVLSFALFLICAIEFLFVPKCGTNVFLFITLVTLVDVLAGSSIWARAAKRGTTVPSAGTA